ncbi:MAG: Alpha-L-glutamate ligase, RimK family [Candidatus Woesebacteria bacterium GW2011_GWA1_37_7]|uniref:Alpha-L-glutamate ligase, RimK family n=1 Tax=Candidatus Woesebacteria bacterium GW2011_GWA1_37_7 TaxID=1618545 RepID=A0A0G0HE17_9BACT|nr:MAG: Alpha-L-glutamate ligase, RimK family [Candidatus Woesebacteria bacterium GW2011_GWA1_37_7]
MNIVLITTRSTLEENLRIAEEAKILGHAFKLIDMKEFEYGITNGKLYIKQFENLYPDIIIMRGVFNSIKSITAYVESLRSKGVKVFDNNFLSHKYSINKIADLIKLAQAGIPVPDSYHLHDFKKYSPTANKLGYPMICKLTRTGKGAGVYKFDNKEDLTKFVVDLENREAEPESYLLQEFIPYKYDLRILIIGSDIFCMRRFPKKGDFRANFSLGGSVELFDLDEKGNTLAINAMQAVGIEVAGVDLLITEDNKRYILEVNHTPGMIGMEKATSKNIAKVYLEYAIKNAR